MDVLKNMSEEELNGLRDDFERLAGEQDGLTIDQFATVLKSAARGKSYARAAMTDKKLHDLFNEIDYNGDTQVSWEEFTMFIIDAAVQGKYEAEEKIQKYALSFEKRRPVGDDEIGGFEVTASVRSMKYVREWDKVLKSTSFSAQHRLKLCHPKTLKCEATTARLQHPAIAIEAIPEREQIVSSNAAMQVNFWSIQVPPQEDEYERCVMPNRSTVQMADSQLAFRWVPEYNTLFSASRGGHLHHWVCPDSTHKDMHVVRTQQVHNQPVFDVLHVDREVVTASTDATAKIWNLERNVCTGTLRGHNQGVTRLAFSDVHQFLLTAGFDAWALVWIMHIKDFKPWRLEDKQRPHQGPLMGLFPVENTPQIITADARGMVKIWDMRNFQCVQTMVPPQDSIKGTQRPLSAITYIDSTASIALTGHRATYLFKSKKTENHRCADDDWTISAVYNPTSRNFLSVHKARFKVWDEYTGVIEQVYGSLAPSDITAFTLCDRGRKFFLGTMQGHVLGYVLSSGQCCQELKAHRGAVSGMAYGTTAAGARFLLSVSMGEPRLLVHADAAETDSVVPRMVTRLLDPDEYVVTCAVAQSISLAIIGTTKGRVIASDINSFSSTHVFDPSPDVREPTGCVAEVSAAGPLGEFPCVCCADVTGYLYLFTVRPHSFPQLLLCRWLNSDGETVMTPGRPPSQGSGSRFERRRSSMDRGVWKALAEAHSGGARAPAVTCFAFHQQKSALYCGDESGGMTVFDLHDVVSDAGLTPMRFPVRFFGDFLKSKSRPVKPPDCETLSAKVKYVRGWRAHQEEISAVQVILDVQRVVVLTASYDLTVRIWTTRGVQLGALCQGRESVRNVRYSKGLPETSEERYGLPEWKFKSAPEDREVACWEESEWGRAQTTMMHAVATRLAKNVRGGGEANAPPAEIQPQSVAEVALQPAVPDAALQLSVPDGKLQPPRQPSLTPPPFPPTRTASATPSPDGLEVPSISRKPSQSREPGVMFTGVGADGPRAGGGARSRMSVRRGSQAPQRKRRQSSVLVVGRDENVQVDRTPPSRALANAVFQGDLADMAALVLASKREEEESRRSSSARQDTLADSGTQADAQSLPDPPIIKQRAKKHARMRRDRSLHLPTLVAPKVAAQGARTPSPTSPAEMGETGHHPPRPPASRRARMRSRTQPAPSRSIIHRAKGSDADPRLPVPGGPDDPTRVHRATVPVEIEAKLSAAVRQQLGIQPQRRPSTGVELPPLIDQLAELRSRCHPPVPAPHPKPMQPVPPPQPLRTVHPSPPAREEGFPFDRVARVRPRVQGYQQAAGAPPGHVLTYWAAP
eukprot:TRINITY_DN18474_c0_g1_i2.p1 TRINITY_DN18474_c0_g1~~TRINITY_DN18474_c0_g1_i2.p1  ORF type:complete len:1317 (+),score=332.54 TRINITY_DN18474_c0_g1_i2:97-4047(+)